MKKRLSLFLLALLVSSAVAQTGNLRYTTNATAGLPDLFGTLAPANFKPRITSEIATKANFTGLDAFFTNVAYAGAVDPAAATPWVGESWVNWNPQTATYAAPTATLDGSYTGISATTINGVDALEITSNLSLPAGVYSLPSNIFVRSGATLTIAAGSVLRGVGTLVIQRGAKLIAAGTATTPIVFTSANAAGSRAAGDNGGIVLLGRARNNNTNGNGFVEGFPEGNDASRYGYGDNSITQDDQDSSGVLRYVRIEFAGKILSPNNEINSLTLGGVGSKTVIDHIQCSWGKDDSYEWFGGTVNAKYLIAYATSDDDFDTDRGFSGKVQFALAVRDASTAESTAGESRGFESDNWVVASQFANPRTTA
ncbi:MAG: cell shape-determining protein MreB, partial [Sphingobacteriia bacterium]